MTELVTPAEIAALAGITEKHVRRVIREFQTRGWLPPRDTWRGAELRIHDGLMVEFSSLPADIRDAALVARDQMALPFPPLIVDRDILECRDRNPAQVAVKGS